MRRPASRAVRPELRRHTAFRVFLTARRRCRGGFLGTTRKRLGLHDVLLHSLSLRRRFSFVIPFVVLYCIYTYWALPPVAAPARYRPQADLGPRL